MYRESISLEWILLPHVQGKKMKTYEEWVSNLMLKGKLRLHQLVGIGPVEIVVPPTNDEIEMLWAENQL